MKKLIIVLLMLFMVSCIPIPAQTRMTLSEAYTKDETNIYTKIQKIEQDYLKYPLTYKAINNGTFNSSSWKITLLTEEDSIPSILNDLFGRDHGYPYYPYRYERNIKEDGTYTSTVYYIYYEYIYNEIWDGYKFNKVKADSISKEFFQVYDIIPKNTRIFTHIFSCKNGFGIPCEMYSKFYVFKNGYRIEKIIIDDYIRGSNIY